MTLQLELLKHPIGEPFDHTYCEPFDTQRFGHTWVLHDCEVTSGVPQLEVPTAAPSERMQLTLRVWVPPPQVAEHPLHPV